MICKRHIYQHILVTLQLLVALYGMGRGTLVLSLEYDSMPYYHLSQLRRNPKAMEHIKMLVPIYERRHQLDSALVFLNQWIALRPKLDSLYYKKANLELQLGDTTLALASEQRAVAMRPSSLRYLTGIASLYFQIGRFDSSAYYYSAIAQLYPESNKPLLWLGYLKLRMGFNKEANDYFNQILSRDQSNPEALNFKAGIYLSDRDYHNALKYYLLVNGENEENPALQNNIAVCQYQLGDYNAAKQYFAKLHNKDVSSSARFFNQSIIAYHFQHYDTAKQNLLQLLSTTLSYSDREEVHYSLARCYKRLCMVDSAASYFHNLSGSKYLLPASQEAQHIAAAQYWATKWWYWVLIVVMSIVILSVAWRYFKG